MCNEHYLKFVWVLTGIPLIGQLFQRTPLRSNPFTMGAGVLRTLRTSQADQKGLRRLQNTINELIYEVCALNISILVFVRQSKQQVRVIFVFGPSGPGNKVALVQTQKSG